MLRVRRTLPLCLVRARGRRERRGGRDDRDSAHRSRISRPGRQPASRRRSRARRRRLVHRAGLGRARLARSEDRSDAARAPRRRLGASRRHRRPGRGAVDHRRRAERDRPGRSEDAARPQLPAARVRGLRQPEHRRLRQARRALVHRAERDLRAARPEGREGAGVPCAERNRPLRHHRHACRRRLLRLARGQLPRPGGRRALHRSRPQSADARPGRATRVVGLEGADLGERVERRQGRDVRARHRTLARVAPPRRDADAVRGLRRRPGRRLAERLRRERPRPLRPRTQKFTRVVLPSSPANVRQILGRPGEVWGAESGVDKLVVVRTR